MGEPQDNRTPTQMDGSDLEKSVMALLIFHAELAMASPAEAFFEPDPVLTLWDEWAEAYDRLVELTQHQKRLETEMFATVRPPSASPANWEAADQLLGYSKARQSELDASAVEETLVAALWETPARSVVGAIAKLQAVLRKGEPSAMSEEYPWPQLRLIMTDTLRVGSRLAC